MNKTKGPAVHVERGQKRVSSEKWRTHVTMLGRRERSVRKRQAFRWITNRKYSTHYNPFFRNGLGQFFKVKQGLDIVEALKLVPGRKNRKRVVIEDGAGEGHNLAKIKELLATAGIPCEAIALSLGSDPSLKTKLANGKINKIVNGPAELYVPEKPVDLVISFYGSLHYTLEDLKKEHLLKFAHSLRKNGLLLTGFDSPIKGKRSAAQTLYEKHKHNALVRALEKRGFKAAVYLQPKGLELMLGEKLPEYMLIVQRTNIFPKKS